MSFQENYFLTTEGNAWFKRNQSFLGHHTDIVQEILRQAGISNLPIAGELGCSNGWRLDQLITAGIARRGIGLDASEAAVQNGRQLFPHLELHHGKLSDWKAEQPLPLVIVSFVLHWIDREILSRCVAAIDESVLDGGFLLIADFYPDAPARRHYHHSNEAVFTYKQDYEKAFEALEIYRPIVSLTFDHDDPSHPLGAVESGRRAKATLLQKSLSRFYTVL